MRLNKRNVDYAHIAANYRFRILAKHLITKKYW